MAFCKKACESFFTLKVTTSLSDFPFSMPTLVSVILDTNFTGYEEIYKAFSEGVNSSRVNNIVFLTPAKSNTENCKLLQGKKCVPFPCDLEILKNALCSCNIYTNSANILKSSFSAKKRLQHTSETQGFEKLAGSSGQIIAIKNQLAKIAPTDLTVLLLGESGTGKTLAAELIHKQSARKSKKFICRNMASIAEPLVESELFGTVTGAYTGAANRQGLFSSANGGTLFMDEIGEVSAAIQTKMLRVLETGFYSSVGSDVEHKTDVRLISATNANLFEMTESNLFRRDLYYRIADYIIVMPSLRERKNDIIEIADKFLNKTNKILSDFALEKIMNYNWPGNIRQLISCLRRASALSPSPIIHPDQIIFQAAC